MGNYNYIGISFQFWNLVRESINEMEKIDNVSLVISKPDQTISKKESWKLYNEKTKWNDFEIGVPLLFNYYHGLELLMKGLLQEEGLFPINNNHKLSSYYDIFKNNEEKYTFEIVELIGEFLKKESPFNDFFTNNNGSVNDFYLMLRYPTTRKQDTVYSFSEIRGTDKRGMNKWIQLRENTKKIRIALEDWKK